jgi:ABC-type transport system involved in multi-copper enzyme maturation permease subunit
MLDAVFKHEMVLAERRGRQRWLRWIFAGWLVCQAFYVAYSELLARIFFQRGCLTFVASVHLTELYWFQQILLIVLLVPGLTAGAITEEKVHGTLQHLLTTELGARHLLIGKQLARSALTGLLLLTSLPLFCWFGGLSGLHPITLLLFVAGQGVLILALAAVSLLASVWCRHTRDAVVIVYAAVIALFGLIHLLGGPLHYLDPFLALAPFDEEEIGARVLAFIAAWGLLGTVSLGLAAARLRPAYQRQLETVAGTRINRSTRSRRPPIGDNPIHWRECHVVGLAPVRAFRSLPRWLAFQLVFIISFLSSGGILIAHQVSGTATSNMPLLPNAAAVATTLGPFDSAVNFAFLVQALVVMLLASLVTGVRCSGAIVGEREKRTWEALLMTPVTARELVRDKLSAVMSASYPYLAAYAIPAILCSALTFSSAVIWTTAGLVLTLLAMYFLGAVGLYCSVRARTSWHSLLGTLAMGYFGGSIAYAVFTPVIFFMAAMLSIALSMLKLASEQFLGVSWHLSPRWGFFIPWAIASVIGLAFVFWLFARFCLTSAQNWIAQRERIRYWEPEARRPMRGSRRRMALPR